VVIIDVLVSIAIRTSQIFLINLELTVLLHTKYYLIMLISVLYFVVNVFSKSVFPCYIPVFWTTLYSGEKQVWQYIEGEIYVKTT